MSDYVRTNNFTAKDALPTGNANKKILGSDVDAELDAAKTAIATKLDKTGGTMTGALVLSGAPSIDLHAATKAYVDAGSGATYFPAGTALLFYNATAPTGWTTATLGARYMACAVSTGGGGVGGGSVSPISWNSAHTHAVSGTSAAGSAHSHSVSITSGAGAAHTHAVTSTTDTNAGLVYEDTTIKRGVIGNESTHTHAVSGTSGAESSHTHSVSITSDSGGGTFSPYYLDCVLGTKS